MVAPLKKVSGIKPADFYGNGLPRPRFFDNPQFNSERIDPPLPVLDPLLTWANDAHWSMGGLSFTRLRLQGRIEGKVSKLRAQLEKSSPIQVEAGRSLKMKRSGSESPPAAPVTVKRRRLLDLNNDDEEIESEDEGISRIRRKLSDDFDRVAGEGNANVIAAATKSHESKAAGKKLKKGKKKRENDTTRTSPRLAKLRSM
ncbi:PREDICTED: uncharacterized protein LOC104824700 [Tarenaya hassleriana]|uniref:uncharacterized protein LOC104824700 n=1 Tax=Tarenaya hassleriana TaxID=28532 RepID=UPI00053CA029|nr:PREDICTED: uncharacterized protein LOC104824700 [Tarenaya hassleriana]